MLKALRYHPLMVGTAEVLVDATRYVTIVLLVLLLMAQKSPSEAGPMISPDPHGRS
jgi:hypothetical protein